MTIRYKIIAPKYVYYTGCIIYFGIATILAFVGIEALSANEEILSLVLQGLSTVVFVFFILVYLRRFIYAKIDRHSSSLLYGNMFIDNEISMNEVSHVERVFFSSKILKIRIDSRRYYMTAIEKGAEREFEKISSRTSGKE